MNKCLLYLSSIWRKSNCNPLQQVSVVWPILGMSSTNNLITMVLDDEHWTLTPSEPLSRSIYIELLRAAKQYLRVQVGKVWFSDVDPTIRFSRLLLKTANIFVHFCNCQHISYASFGWTVSESTGPFSR